MQVISNQHRYKNFLYGCCGQHTRGRFLKVTCIINLLILICFYLILLLDTLSQEHFTALLDQRVQFITIAPGAVGGVIDNERIHHILATRMVLEEVFDSLYYFLSVNIKMHLGSSLKYFIIQNHRFSPTIWPPELGRDSFESKYTLEFLKIERASLKEE